MPTSSTRPGRWCLATLVGSLLICTQSIAAEAPPGSSSLPLNLTSGRLFTTEGQEVLFSKLILSGESCEYWSKGLPEAKTLLPDKVLRVERQSGNEAAKWGLIMGLSGLAGSLLGVAQGESQAGGTVSSGAKTGIVVGLTGVSTLVGVLLGASHKKYATVYENPRFERR